MTKILVTIFLCIMSISILVPKTFATPSGQGLFIVSSCTSITSPVNGQTWCFLANSNPPALYEYVNNVFTSISQSSNLVTAYGAKCDDITDDTAAFNTALTSAQTVLGGFTVSGSITVPSNSVCKINGQLNIPYFVNFDATGTTLDFTNLSSTGTAIQIGNPGPATTRWEGRWKVKLGVVNGPGSTTTSTAVLFGGTSSPGFQVSNLDLDGGTIENFGTALKLGNNAFLFTVENMHITLNGKGWDELSTLTASGENILFLHNQFDHQTGPHLNLGSGAGIASDITLLSNSFDDSCEPYLVLNGGLRLTSKANHFENDGDLACGIISTTAASYYDIKGLYETVDISNDTIFELIGSMGRPTGIPIAWDTTINNSNGMLKVANEDWHVLNTRNLLDCVSGKCSNPAGSMQLEFDSGSSIAEGCGSIGTFWYNNGKTSCRSGNNFIANLNNKLNPLTYGARSDAVYCSNNGSITGSTFTESGICTNFTAFLNTDVGKYIAVSGAGPNGLAYQGTISAITNSVTVTVTPAPTSNVTSKAFTYGTDNTIAIQAAETACEQQGSTNQQLDWPLGSFITGPVQLGNPSTAATAGQTTQAPGCSNNYGAGRFGTTILVKPGSAYGFQRNNTVGTTVQNFLFQSALPDGLIADQPVTMLDMSWLAGTPSASANIESIHALDYNGVGINTKLLNDSNIGKLWSGSNWASGQALTGAILSCTSSGGATSDCSTNKITCNITNNPFVSGEWVHIGGITTTGYNITSAVPVLSPTSSTIGYCSLTVPSVSPSTGGTATLTPITIDAEGTTGQIWLHDFVSAGNGTSTGPGLLVIAAQNWRLSNCTVYGGMLINSLAGDYNFGQIDGCQFLTGDPNNSHVHIESPPQCNNIGTQGLVINSTVFSGTSQTVFDGHFVNGFKLNNDSFNDTASGNIFGTMDTSCGAVGGYRPVINFQQDNFNNIIMTQPINYQISIKDSGVTNSTLLGTSITSTSNINLDTIYSVAGIPLPTCSAGTIGWTNLKVSDATSCSPNGIYTGSGTTKCQVFCGANNSNQWTTTGLTY